VRDFINGIAPTGLADKVAGLAKEPLSHGLVPCISFKPPVNTPSGSYNAELTKLRDYLKTVAQPLWLALFHEPEDNMSGTEYRDMFKYVRSFLQCGPNVVFVYAANAYAWRPKSSSTADPTPWGQVNADVFAIDIYSGRSWPLATTMWELPCWDRWFGMVNGRKWAVTERGWYSLTPNPDRVKTIYREVEELLAGVPVKRLPEAYIYWNTEGTEKDPALLMPEATQAINDCMAQLAPAQIVPPEDTGRVVVRYGNPHQLLIDGVEFPWKLTGDISVGLAPAGTPTVTLTLPATDVEIEDRAAYL
jgi:hypothetical protein